MNQPARAARAGAVVASALLLLLLATAAGASPVDTFGLGGRGSALGDATTALLGVPEATFANPANLGFLERGEVFLGPMWTGNGLWIEDLERERFAPDYTDVEGLYFGASGPLGRLFRLEGLALGVLLFIPGGGFAQVDIPQRSSERTFFKYRDRNKRIQIDAALAYRIFDWVSIGLGADLLLDLWAATDITLYEEKWLGNPNVGNDPDYFAANSQEGVNISLSRSAGIRAAPVAGLTVRPLEWLTFGACYRGEQKVPSTGRNSLDLEMMGADEPEAMFRDPFDLTAFFVPQQVSLGLAVRPLAPLWPHDWLLVSFDAVWENWAAYLDHRSETPMEEIDGRAFGDVWSLRGGLEVTPWAPLDIRVGLRWEPTPAPLPVGEENLLDADSLIITAGLGLDLESLLADWWSVPVSLDVFFRWHRLNDLTVRKNPRYVPEDQLPPDDQRWVDLDPADEDFLDYSPGYPEYSAGGHIWSVGFSLTYRFGEPAPAREGEGSEVTP